MKIKIVFAICLSLTALSCSNRDSRSSKKEDSEKINVTTTKAIELDYSPELNFPGTAQANREVNLSSAIPGRVEKIYYREGSFVQEGAKIAELSDEMLIQAQIECETLKKDFERLERLKEKGSISIIDYDHLKARYEASEAKVALLKKNTSITAPFSGVLVDIMIHEGENYSFIPSSVSTDLKVKSGIVTLMQLNPLKVKIEINEKEISLINIGMDAKLKFDSYPEADFRGKVVGIKSVLSAISRTVPVEIEVPNSGSKLKPGMYCNVTINRKSEKGIFVPINALYRQSGTGDDFIFILKPDSTVERRAVTRGEMVGDKVHISGIEENTEIIIDGKNRLTDGSSVVVIKK